MTNTTMNTNTAMNVNMHTKRKTTPVEKKTRRPRSKKQATSTQPCKKARVEAVADSFYVKDSDDDDQISEFDRVAKIVSDNLKTCSYYSVYDKSVDYAIDKSTKRNYSFPEENNIYFGIGQCYACGAACNMASQACGHCMRII